MATFPIYEIYVELNNYSPKMWRRFQVLGDATIAKIGYIIMSLYEVRNYYAYEFRIDEFDNYKRKHPEYVEDPHLLENINKDFRKLRYGITKRNNTYTYSKTDGYKDLLDATSEKLINIIKAPNEKLVFRYDPEINWSFNIIIEKIFTDKNLYAKDLPKVLDGAGYGIIETLNRCKRA